MSAILTNKISQNNEKKARNFTNEEIRLICRNYVVKTLKDYVISMKRWGILTDFRAAYNTMCNKKYQ